MCKLDDVITSMLGGTVQNEQNEQKWTEHTDLGDADAQPDCAEGFVGNPNLLWSLYYIVQDLFTLKGIQGQLYNLLLRNDCVQF